MQPDRSNSYDVNIFEVVINIWREMVGLNRTLTDICLVVGNPYADASEGTYLIASPHHIYIFTCGRLNARND